VSRLEWLAECAAGFVDLSTSNLYRSSMAEETWVVFSDIHSNLEAFQSVLADMRTLRFNRMICLGDVAGYAASPKDCLDLLRTLETEVLQGNHDFAVVDDGTLLDMSGPAVAGIRYAREQFSAARREFFAALPLVLSQGDLQFVHSSLDHPEAWTYLRREPEIRAHFAAQTDPVCFCGHTHIPGVFQMDPASDMHSLGSTGRVELPREGRILINAGSVGQPRDRNPDACYVVFETGTRTVEFRRIPYDIEAAQARILEAGLPRITAERLASGR
jgi:diadenosine tetraphosphatase ApaH/serine/threonine PP2A family protein phosphatase